mgnify:CR=1
MGLFYHLLSRDRLHALHIYESKKAATYVIGYEGPLTQFGVCCEI